MKLAKSVHLTVTFILKQLGATRQLWITPWRCCTGKSKGKRCAIHVKNSNPSRKCILTYTFTSRSRLSSLLTQNPSNNPHIHFVKLMHKGFQETYKELHHQASLNTQRRRASELAINQELGFHKPDSPSFHPCPIMTFHTNSQDITSPFECFAPAMSSNPDNSAFLE